MLLFFQVPVNYLVTTNSGIKLNLLISDNMQQHSLNEIKLTLTDIEKMLLDLNLPQDETSSDRAFLRNTKKTTAFLNVRLNLTFI